MTEQHPTDAPTNAPPALEHSQRAFEEYTLAEAFALFFRAPRRTVSAVRAVTQTPRRTYSAQRVAAPYFAEPLGRRAVPDPDSLAPDIDALASQAEMRTALVRVVAYGVAALLFFIGNVVLVPRFPLDPNKLDFVPFSRGVPFFLAGFIVVFALEFYLSRRGGRSAVFETGDAFPQPPAPSPTRREGELLVLGSPPRPTSVVGESPFMARDLGGEGKTHLYNETLPEHIDAPRWILLPFAVGCGAFAFMLNAYNTFTAGGVLMWLAAIGLMVLAFAPYGWNPLDRFSALLWHIDDTVRREWRVLLIVALITLAGAVFRFQDLANTPPEMTSDHIEKLNDAQRVVDGEYDVFFRGNGGREAMQMYLIALATVLPGVEMNFDALKLVAALEGILAIPVVFYLGRTIAGDQRRIFGTWLGVALAVVMAFGYWHVMVGRVSLRIILTPLIASLLLIVLIRAMRYNRRVDYIGAGLILGFGLYTYQAVRMLPVLVVVGVALAILLYAKNWAQRKVYAVNFVMLVLVAFTVFIPLFRFSVDYPDDFWRRSAGRLFGDELIEEVNADGVLVERQSTLEERLTAFNNNLPILGDNVYRALLMFNYRGDIIYLHNAPNFPAMDPITAAFFLLGVGLWGARIARTRDPVDVLIPLALVIMLLPSALSIANPNENPSHTRASGAMPEAYLLAAYGMVMLVMPVRRLALGWLRDQRAVPLVGALLLGVLGLGMYSINAYNVLTVYHEEYVDSWKPLSDGGKILREFAESERGGYGNAFMVAYPHWWDYRIVANEAGLVPNRWLNGDIQRQNLPVAMAAAYNRPESDPLRLDPNKDLLFMYADEDTETSDLMYLWFPRGLESRIPTYKPDVTVRTYRVPAPGAAELEAFLSAQGQGF